MKALSIRQPWAWLIANGHKDIENRTWRTKFRGGFLVHAGKKFDDAGYDWVVNEMDIVLPRKEDFERGGVVGEAEIIDCVSRFDSPWFSGPFGFVIRGATPLPFHACRGRLGFFDIDNIKFPKRIEKSSDPNKKHVVLEVECRPTKSFAPQLRRLG